MQPACQMIRITCDLGQCQRLGRNGAPRAPIRQKANSARERKIRDTGFTVENRKRLKVAQKKSLTKISANNF
jgi:hypothetical protein